MSADIIVHRVSVIRESVDVFPEGTSHAFVSTNFTFLDERGKVLSTLKAFCNGTEAAKREVLTRASLTKGAESA
jgi:hypothetical protein